MKHGWRTTDQELYPGIRKKFRYKVMNKDVGWMVMDGFYGSVKQSTGYQVMVELEYKCKQGSQA